MLNLLIRQAKVNTPLTNIVHAKLLIQTNDKKVSISSVDILASTHINVIEFNSSCEVLSSRTKTNKVDFSLIVTDKFVETNTIGIGSCILMPEDHGSTKFVYLYDENDQKSTLIATVTYTVFFHESPAIDIAEKNINRLKASTPGRSRSLTEKELSFLIKRRMNWMNRGPYPATFDYKAEKQLDREMMLVYGRGNKDRFERNRSKSPLITRSVQKPLSTSSSPAPTRHESPKSRQTQMKVGYLGAAWPDVEFYQREKMLYRQYLAEERRLQARIEVSKYARHRRGSTPTGTATIIKEDKGLASLMNALEKKDMEINSLRRSLRDEKLRASAASRQQQRQQAYHRVSPSHLDKYDATYTRETDASRQRRLSTLYHSSNIEGTQVTTKSTSSSSKRPSSASSSKPKSRYSNNNNSNKSATRMREYKNKNPPHASSSPYSINPAKLSSKSRSHSKSSPMKNNYLSSNIRHHQPASHGVRSQDASSSDGSSIDTAILVNRFDEAFIFARQQDDRNRPDDEELDDALDEFKEADDGNAFFMQHIASNNIHVPPPTYDRKHPQSDMMAFAYDIIDNLSPSSVSTSAYIPNLMRMNESSITASTATYEELAKSRLSTATTTTTKFKRYDNELKNFGDEIEDVKERVEQLAGKMASTKPIATSNHIQVPDVNMESDKKESSSADNSSTYSDLLRDSKYDAKDSFSYLSNDSKLDSNSSSSSKRYVAQGRSPVERALVKSMNHLSSILARLQAHDSLMSGSSAHTSPSKYEQSSL